MIFFKSRILSCSRDAAIHGFTRLPPIHQDPFDRILIVQAKLTGSTLVSTDKIFSQYPVNVRWG